MRNSQVTDIEICIQELYRIMADINKRISDQVTIDFGDLDETEREWLRDRGVIREGLKLYSPPKRPRYVDDFQTTPNFTHQYMALEPGIGLVAHRVFHYLCYVLQYDNWVDISTVWVAEKLSLKRPQVSKAISTLEKKGLLIRGEKIGRHYKWRLNPEATWKGTAKARWDSLDKGIPYSDFIEKRLQYGDEHGFPLGYLRGLRPIDGGNKTNVTKEQLERESEYNRILRIKFYGEEYADDVPWDKLSEAEIARLQIRRAKVQIEMEESGEWDELNQKYFPQEKTEKAEVINIAEKAEQKKKAIELAEKLISSDIDLDQLNELLKKSAKR